MKHVRKRLTYANVMSSIAVFLVLGGGAALAATTLPANSVGTKQIQKQAVKTGKIAKKAVRTGKLDAEAVKAGKLARESIVTNRLRDNVVNSDKVNSSIQTTADLLFATVAPADGAAAIVRGRGATGVTRVAAGFYVVTFDREVTDCSWVATYGQPNNTGVNAVWATVRGFTEANQVGVVLRNENGTQVDGNGFHLAVLCP